MTAPRVLFVTNLLTHYRKPLYEELARRTPVRFVFFSDGGEWYWRGEVATSDVLDAVTLRGRWVGRTRVTPGLFREVLLRSYDVAVVPLVGKFALAVTYAGARLRRKPVVLWATLWAHPGTAFHRRTRFVTDYLYRHADAVVTYGRHVSAHVVARGADPARVFVAPQAVDLTRFTSDGRAAYDGPVRIGYVGRLEPEKGVTDLLAALAMLDERGVAYRLTVVGSGSVDVPTRGQVANADLPAVYRDLDVVVVPSRLVPEFAEPWSLAVNEAMGCGVCVVASDAVGAVQDGLVTNGTTGLVFRHGDVAALADALATLAHDADLRERLAASGRHAVRAYTYEAAADGFVRAAQAALSTRERREPRRKRALPTK